MMIDQYVESDEAKNTIGETNWSNMENEIQWRELLEETPNYPRIEGGNISN